MYEYGYRVTIYYDVKTSAGCATLFHANRYIYFHGFITKYSFFASFYVLKDIIGKIKLTKWIG